MLVNDLVYYKDGEGNIMSSGYKVNSILLKSNTPIMETLSKKYENLAVPCGLYYFNKHYHSFINIGGNNNDNDSDNDNDNDSDNDNDNSNDNSNDNDNNTNNKDEESINIINGGKNIISNDLYEKLLEMVKINKKVNKTKKINKSKSKIKKVKKTKKNN
jgi:hypothetical protein